MLKRKLTAYFEKRKFAFLIAFTALCIGMVVGASGAWNLESKPETILNQMPAKEIIVSSIAENLKFLGWIVLWSVNLIGFPVIVYLLIIKGASISAAVCALTMWDNPSKIAFLVSAIPYLACVIASVMIMSQGGLCCSFSIFKSIWTRRAGKGIRDNVITMVAEFVPAILLTLVGGICETVLKVNIA